MNKYTVKIIDCECEIDSAPKAEITLYPWKCDGDYRVRTYAQMAFVKDKGLLIKMTCAESNPKAVITEFYSTVCFDSCMECFFTLGESGKYVNLEMNSKGISHIGLGEGRHGRVPVTDFIDAFPPISNTKGEDYWTAAAFFSFDELYKLFGVKKEELVSGYKFKANFYKCGDKTEFEHYGMWNLVEWPTPDFHRPEFFGELTVE